MTVDWRASDFTPDTIGPEGHVRGVAEQHRGEWWAEVIMALLERRQASDAEVLKLRKALLDLTAAAQEYMVGWPDVGSQVLPAPTDEDPIERGLRETTAAAQEVLGYSLGSPAPGPRPWLHELRREVYEAAAAFIDRAGTYPDDFDRLEKAVEAARNAE